MSICERCKGSFTCGMADSAARANQKAGLQTPCWCTQLPLLPPAQIGRDSASCYCPACLRQLLKANPPG